MGSHAGLGAGSHCSDQVPAASSAQLTQKPVPIDNFNWVWATEEAELFVHNPLHTRTACFIPVLDQLWIWNPSTDLKSNVS